MKNLQKLGKAMMQPVAVLPIAALLVGIGYWIDPVGWGGSNKLAAILIKSGTAILDNIPIIFAAGVAYGLSKDNNGAAALAGLVSFLVLKQILNPGTVAMLKGLDANAADYADQMKYISNELGFAKIENALTGILSGLVGALSYNKFYDKKLPDALAFFSGRRMTPIVASFIMIFVSIILYFIWPVVFAGLVKFGNWMIGLGALGAGLFGFFNRLLIPFGLHHALNSVFWLDTIGIGDITNFLAGAQALEAGTAVKGVTGMYQAGFFPIMMFGLPAAALAMYTCAKPEKKKEAMGVLLAGAIASFATGVTEPLEFSFMFLAPVLYLVHSILTGISLAVATLLKSTAGFGFSAGVVDFILSLKNPVANKPWLLMLMGLVAFVIYFVVFRLFIKKMDLKTPGREDGTAETVKTEKVTTAKSGNDKFRKQAETIIAGLGGIENISSFDYCTTRIRATVNDPTKVNDAQIKSSGASGLIKPDAKSIQVVVGPQVQFVYDEMVKMS